MTDTVRALLATTLLAGSAFGIFVWRLVQIDAAEPGRLIGELRLSQWTALILAGVGGAWLGVTATQAPPGLGAVEVTVAVATITFAGWTMLRETRQSLLLLCLAFLAHALIDLAHRPGWLTDELAPRWFTAGCAAFNVYMAALCFWVQRR